MKRTFQILLTCLTALIMAGCEKFSTENTLVISTPDAGDLTFTYHVFADNESGQYDVIAFTGGKTVNDMVSLMFLFDKGIAAGKEIILENCHFGLDFSSFGGDYTSELTSGHIYLKAKASDQIVLEFKDASFTTARGEYRLSGYQTFEPMDE